MNISLPGVAFVTGAGRGMGKAICKRFAEVGAKAVVMVDRNGDDLEKAAAELTASHPKVGLLKAALDVGDEEKVKSVIAQAVEKFGRIDYAVNCAGIVGRITPLGEATVADFDQTNSVNLRAVYICMAHELRQMLKQEPLELRQGRGQRGSIVNFSSVCGIVAVEHSSAYNATKHGVIGLTKSACVDHAKDGIRANVILPGFIDTPLVADASRSREEIDNRMASGETPMCRFGQVEEIADCTLFLCSDASSYVNGASLSVDGGYVAR